MILEPLVEHVAAVRSGDPYAAALHAEACVQIRLLTTQLPENESYSVGVCYPPTGNLGTLDCRVDQCADRIHLSRPDVNCVRSFSVAL